MKSCVSHKKIYLTSELAEEALIGARTAYEFSNGTGPVSIYLCEDCGGYHLTSKGTMNVRLAKLISEGKIKQQKEADHWTRKLDRRR